MNKHFYSDNKNLLTTKISGSREHFSWRPKITVRTLSVYRVKREDSFYDIADIFTLDTGNWNLIADVNAPVYPDDLYPTMDLVIPQYFIETSNDGVRIL